MVLMAGVDLPIRAIREQIVGGLHLVVHQSRMKDGTRKVTKITEIVGMEGDVITLQDIFEFQEQGISDGKVQGVFKATGVIPKLLPALESRGASVPVSIFS
jgi:pilus assembly protein CpaF